MYDSPMQGMITLLEISLCITSCHDIYVNTSTYVAIVRLDDDGLNLYQTRANTKIKPIRHVDLSKVENLR
jgi:hypothetical protein